MPYETTEQEAKRFTPDKQQFNFNPPPGREWTEKWHTRNINLEDVMYKRGRRPGGEMTPATGQIPQQDYSTGYQVDQEWNYKTAKLGKEGESLPHGATAWKPDGGAYYGSGFEGTWNKLKSLWETGILQEEEGTKEYEAKRAKIEEAEGVWEKTKAVVGTSTSANVAKIAWVGIIEGIFTTAEEVLGRPLTTASMVLEDLSEDSSWKPLSTKFTDWMPGKIETFFQRASPVRAVHNFVRGIEAQFTSNKDWTFDEKVELWKSNWAASRMGWSIGAGEQSYKAEFLTRVAEGENPDLVAMEMSRPGPELLGDVVFDLMGVVSALKKGSAMVGTMDDISDTLLKGVPELSELFAKHGDEAVSALKGSQNIDEIAEAITKSSARITEEVTTAANKFGLGELVGTAKRNQAATESGIFGQWVAAVAKDPDEATAIFQNMARLMSEDPMEKKRAIDFLVHAIENPEPAFSDGGLKFAKMISGMFLDEAGHLDEIKFADEFLELQKSGDAQKLWDFLGGKLDDVINKTFPLVDEVIEAGGKVPWTMRMLSRWDAGTPGSVKQAVNWFAGRAYIGTNPGVAVRGGLYDLFQSVVDTDVSIMTKSPGKWSDLSVKWLGGVEHAGLVKGFSKAEIRSLDRFIVKETSYTDIPSFFEALKGGKDLSKLDRISLPFARLLQRFEISSSQRIIGKATDEGMKHILRSDGAFAVVDDLVKAGLPKATADGLVERIIGNYGDVDKVKKLLMEEIGAGKMDLFSSANWLDDASRKVLDEFGITDEFLEAVKSGKPMNGILDDLFKIKDDLMTKTERLAEQHVQAIVDGISNPENVAQVNKGLYEAIESGAPLQGVLDKANDVFHIDKITKNAWMDAGEDLVNRAISHFEGLGDKQTADIIRQLRANGVFRHIGDEFSTVTMKNSEIMDNIVLWAEKIRKSKPEEMLEVVREAEKVFGIENLPKDKRAANALWEILKGDQQGEMFRKARQATRVEFEDVLKELRKVVPEDLLDSIVGSSAKVERANLMERLATQFDNSLMIDGKLKPVGEYVRTLIAGGDNKNAIRILAANARLVGTAKTGSDLFDSDILFVLKQFGIDANTLDDIDPEDAFKALQEWRNLRGLSRQGETLADILGNFPNVKVHTALSDVARIIRAYNGTIDGDELQRLVRFIRENGVGDDITDLKALIQANDEEAVSSVVDLAKRVQDNIFDDIATGAGKVNAGKATAEIKYLLQKAGIKFDDGITQREAWRLLYGKAEEVVTTPISRHFRAGPYDNTAMFANQAQADLYDYGSMLEKQRSLKFSELHINDRTALINKADELKASLIERGVAEDVIDNLARDISKDIKTQMKGAKNITVELVDNIGIPSLADEVISVAPKVAPDVSKVADEVASIVPPFDGGVPTEARNIWERRNEIDATFARVADGVQNNYGKFEPVEGLADDFAEKADSWFDIAKSRVNDARLMSSKYAQGVRDFTLHDYHNRYGFDNALSYLYNFHFWPSRTAGKWLSTRIWQNPALVSSYMDYREFMQNIHKDSPEWWRYSINSNELLGLNMKNPLYFRLENMLQPIFFMGGSDFKDDKKRVNWWTTMIDDIGRFTPGYFNPLINYAVATALRAKGETEAASRWAGRLLPTTGLVQSITSIIGIKGGEGLEVDPSIHIYSGGMGPYEKNRVAKTLAGFVKDGKYTEEEIVDAAYNHTGPIWDEAVASQRQEYGVGNIISTFAGINTRQRTPADLAADSFWSDYIRLMSQSADMPPDELRYNMEKVREAYPMMDALLLGRMGDEKRDEGYAWSVLSRIKPGKTDDLSTALGLPYDMVSKFYEDKGDFSEWIPADKNQFMSAIIGMGAALELPAMATRKEWAAAGIEYGGMLDIGMEYFGENIWEKLDMAYVKRNEGMNGNVEFQRFLEQNPDVEEAIRWRDQYILENPLLSAYYGGQEKLRDYYKGVMYQEIENELGRDIWDKWSVYWSYVDTGQSEEASAYKKAHPELKKYSELKKEKMDVIEGKILEYSEELPEGKDMRLRPEEEDLTFGEQAAREFVNQPQTVSYTKSEWVNMIGAEETRAAIMIWEGISVGGVIEEYLERIANNYGMSYEEFIMSIGQAD